MLKHIISGGQTGVDRAALDAALQHGIRVSGWCPRGRLAEDGVIPSHYPLSETPSSSYQQRTAWNVRDSDGTLILMSGRPDEGTQYTMEIARQLKRPLLVIDLLDQPAVSDVKRWIDENSIESLNIAGPRESNVPGIYYLAKRLLRDLVTNGYPARS